jgi:hypothetical protein
VGTHRRISAARSNPCAANAGGPTGRARREGWVGLDSKIDRPTDPSPRAVKGARRQFPLRSSGFQGVAARVGGFCSVAAPISLRAGRNGQRASRGLYIGDSHGVAEPRHALPPLTAPPRQLAPHTVEGATLGQEGIPMSQIAPAMGMAPARRLRRPAAGGCGSIRLIPRSAADEPCWPHDGRGFAHTSPYHQRSSSLPPGVPSAKYHSGITELSAA